MIDFILPGLFVVLRGVVVAFLIVIALSFTLRVFDKRSGISFGDYWREASEIRKTKYLTVRFICVTAIFIFSFTIA